MPIYNIYCDESSTTTGQFMIIGGVILPDISDASIKQGIIDKKKSLGLVHEVSWDSVSKSNLHRYIELIDYMFLLIHNGKICFKAIIVDKYKYDKVKHDNVKDKPFYKMYFQLLYHKFCKVWHKPNKSSFFYIMPDEKSSNISLLNLKDYLNYSIKAKLNTQENLVLGILPQVSKNSPIIQIVDLYIGCLSYYINRYWEIENASKNKIAIMNHIQSVFNREDICQSTGIRNLRYEIWKIKFY